MAVDRERAHGLHVIKMLLEVNSRLYILLGLEGLLSVEVPRSHPVKHTTIDRNPQDLFLAKDINHKRKTSMNPAGFQHATPESERPQTRAATWAGLFVHENS